MKAWGQERAWTSATRMNSECSEVRLGELNDGQVMLDLVSIFRCSFKNSGNPLKGLSA